MNSKLGLENNQKYLDFFVWTAVTRGYAGGIPQKAGGQGRTGEGAGHAIPKARTGYEPAMGGEFLNIH